MISRPVVSTVINTFDRPDGLRRALASVGEQRIDGHEVIVVNDAGPDVSAVLAEARERMPVRLIDLPSNRGLGAARKVGIAAARGRHVAFLDDDDVWLPGHLSTVLEALDGSSMEVVYTTCLVAHVVTEPGQPVQARHQFAMPFDPDLLAVANLTPVISAVARRFDPHDPAVDAQGAMQEDWAMWLGLVHGHGWRMRHVDLATTVYHRIPSVASMTGSAASTIDGVRRFAAGHRELHWRWPVAPGSPAGRARWMPHRMYQLVEQRHAAREPVDMYYYERCLPLFAAAVNGQLDTAPAEAALAAAVAPQSRRSGIPEQRSSEPHAVMKESLR
ncbi:hypothetical protein Aca07nite_87060 [Actinoplanes capillaceus]|uniref:Glycosyltransferase 2-like domain-containing protein n=1 Tax=Actinoplanes campanulatus TaxID=113559 RepID=A0ABQ3WZ40_9ACTN|nr:glycosyltransferase family 2 protein [Actinoplanes capillaceus]GID51431.1 hypothetical protein Aca07nite_87060 [Actinoplanes capillaceus]